MFAFVNSKGYESIGIMYPEDSYNWFKNIKVIFSLIFILIISFIIFLFVRQHKSNKYLDKSFILEQSNFNKYSLRDFTDILPKINKNNVISNVDELFNSRILYINDKNVTNEYIRFLRPINLEEEEKIKKYSFQGINFDDYKGTTNGKLSLNDFYNLCNKDKLNNLINIPINEKPDISIIIPLLKKSKINKINE